MIGEHLITLNYDVDDHVTSYMTFANRASTQFECSWSANIKEDKVHVSLSGEDGGINLFSLKYMSPALELFLKAKLMLSITKTLLVRDRRVTLFNACLGIEEIVVKPEEARNVNALIEAIYRSKYDNKSIQLNDYHI